MLGILRSDKSDKYDTVLKCSGSKIYNIAKTAQIYQKARIQSEEFKSRDSTAHLGRAFAMGKVFGFNIKFYDRSIVSFGSLWHKYEDILKKYQNCDIFIAPLAGNIYNNLHSSWNSSRWLSGFSKPSTV